jgi:hypothetical protein
MHLKNHFFLTSFFPKMEQKNLSLQIRDKEESLSLIVIEIPFYFKQ